MVGGKMGVGPRPLRVGRLPSFHDAPAVVAAAFHAVEQFPQFPADIAAHKSPVLRSKLIRHGLRKP